MEKPAASEALDALLATLRRQSTISSLDVARMAVLMRRVREEEALEGAGDSAGGPRGALHPSEGKCLFVSRPR